MEWCAWRRKLASPNRHGDSKQHCRRWRLPKTVRIYAKKLDSVEDWRRARQPSHPRGRPSSELINCSLDKAVAAVL